MKLLFRQLEFSLLISSLVSQQERETIDNFSSVVKDWFLDKVKNIKQLSFIMIGNHKN